MVWGPPKRCAIKVVFKMLAVSVEGYAVNTA